MFCLKTDARSYSGTTSLKSVQILRDGKIREEHGLDAWREQVERAWLTRDEVRILSWEAAGTYSNFLDSMFFYYGENARAVERATREG
jgi:hypothetical protein